MQIWYQTPHPHITPHEFEWMIADGSLTKRLMQLGTVEVHVHIETSGDARPDETIHLSANSDIVTVWQREVSLLVDGTALVNARSVCSLTASTGAWSAIRGLGTQPLANLLYHDARITRSRFEHALLPCNDLYKHSLWARRSVFLKDNQPLIVMEAFLPSFWTYLTRRQN